MAVDCYMAFKPYNGAWLAAESQVDMSKNKEELATTPSQPTAGCLFEIEEYSFNVEQTLNITSQSSGAGAGKITLNPFSITRPIDKASTTFFTMACNGTAFESVVLMLRKSLGTGAAGQGGDEVSGGVFLRFDFKFVAVKSINWNHDETSPKEAIEFEYGGLQMRYAQQEMDGTLGTVLAAGWNSIQNIADTGSTAIKKK